MWAMKIGIIGAGAIGGWVAARLALAGNPVSVLARGETLTALRDGLTIREGGVTEIAKVNASADPAAIGPQELLVIAVKAPALADVAARVGPMIGPETLIVPMLNGVPWWFLDGEPLASVTSTGRLRLPFRRTG